MTQPGVKTKSPRNKTTKTPDGEVLDTEPQGFNVSEILPREDEPQGVINEPDTWHIVGDALVRKHNTPRTALYVPSPEDCPLPLKYIDIFRHTQTDLSSSSESDIVDHYTDGPIELSDSWVGTTKFHLLRPQP